MYIITNTTYMNEYTPSTTDTLQEAKAWMQKCTADNLRAWKDGIIELENMSDEEIIQWAKEHESEFEYDEMHSLIVYGDFTYNRMQIYKI